MQPLVRRVDPAPSLLALGLLVVPLLACEAPAALGAACTRSSECGTPLTCSYGRCRTECLEARDCPLGVRCIEAAGGGVCTVETEERCTDAICAAPLRCVDGQCRTECVVSTDCQAGECDRGSCIERVSGVDAGMPDAGSGDTGSGDAGAFACDPTTAMGHDALLDTILGTDRGPSGFRTLAVGRVPAFTAPQTAAGFLPGQIAVTAQPDAGFGQAWIAYLEGAERVLHLVRFGLEDPSDLRHFFPAPTSTTIDHVESFALATDGDLIRGVVAREAPALATDVSAWVFVRGAIEPVITPRTSMSTPPRAQPGRVAITGGQSPFASLVVPLYFIFREHDASRGALLAHANVDLGGYAEVDTGGLLPDGFVETDGAHGPLAIGYDPSRGHVLAWDQRAPFLGDPFDVVLDATGVPAIATEPGTTIRSVVAYPRSADIAFRGVDCPAGDVMPCQPSTTRFASVRSTSGEVRRVDLSPVTNGFAFAALEAEVPGAAGVSIPIRHVDFDLADVWDCDSGAPCLADVFPSSELAEGEAIVDMRLSTTRSANGVGTVLAVLIRDASSGTDRIWVGGFYACGG